MSITMTGTNYDAVLSTTEDRQIMRDFVSGRRSLDSLRDVFAGDTEALRVVYRLERAGVGNARDRMRKALRRRSR